MCMWINAFILKSSLVHWILQQDFKVVAMKTCQLSTEKKATIMGMHKTGMKMVRIAMALNIPPPIVYSVVQRCKFYAIVVSPKPTRRPPKLTTWDKRKLGWLMTQHCCLKLSKLVAALIIKVPQSTMKTTIKSLGFLNQIATKKPHLQDRHKTERLQFAWDHEH